MNPNLNARQYWVLRMSDSNETPAQFLSNLNTSKRYFRETLISEDFINKPYWLRGTKKFTVIPSGLHTSEGYTAEVKLAIKTIFSAGNTSKGKSAARVKLSYERGTQLDNYLYLKFKTDKYYKRRAEKLLLAHTQSTYMYDNKSNNVFNALNVNFLRKERLYTKLKYSRTPAYDIVSGGAAALLAGFIGFLVTEKFGFELIDSGDFYFFFMYVVFLTFSVRPLLLVVDPSLGLWEALSIRRVLDFYSTLLCTIFYNLRNLKS